MLFQTGGFEQRIEDANPFHRKFCGFMSLRGGCAVACAIWVVSSSSLLYYRLLILIYSSLIQKGLNTYIATIAFMGYTRKKETSLEKHK
jgi:hypothetical protein